MTRKYLFSSLAAALLLALSGTTLAASGGDGRYEVYHFERVNATVSPGAGNGAIARAMRFQALGRDFDIRLHGNERLVSGLPDETRERILATVEIYRGELMNAQGSWVRLTRDGTRWQGLIWDGFELFIVESGQSPETEATARLQTREPGPVIYRLADTNAAFSDIAIEMPADAIAALAATSGTDEALLQTAQMNAATKRLDIAAIGDFEYTNGVSGNGQSQIINFINGVDGIFDSQLGIQVNLVDIRTFAQNNDPFTGTSDPRDLIDELADYKAGDSTLRNQGLVHLFTGVNLDDTTIGIAFLNSVCSSQFGVSLTQALGAPTPTYLITAHEMGHNFGAPHDGDPDEACGNVVSSFLMATTFNGNDQFSSCSISEMQPVINGANCLSDISPVDVRSVIPANPVNALTGETFSYQVEVENVGGSTANNVSLEMEIPAGLTVSQADFDGGNCTISTATVTCQRGTLNTMAVATASLEISGATPGNYPMTAVATADNDSDPLNDNANGTIILAAATDVSIDISLADEFVLNSDSTSITIAVENNGPRIADSVTASIDFAESLTVSPGQAIPFCVEVNAGQGLDCDFGDIDFPPMQGHQFIVLLDASATASEVFPITGQVASDTMDFDLTNNDVSKLISVGGRFADVLVTVVNPSTSLIVGDSGSAVMRLTNNGPNSAGLATLTVSAGPGIGSMGVSANIPCNVTNNVVSCSATDFSGSQNITISFVATASGTSSIQAVAQVGGADDLDSNQGNNSASFGVTIGSPPTNNGGGGGGGASGPGLSGLMILLLLMRRRPI